MAPVVFNFSSMGLAFVPVSKATAVLLSESQIKNEFTSISPPKDVLNPSKFETSAIGAGYQDLNANSWSAFEFKFKVDAIFSIKAASSLDTFSKFFNRRISFGEIPAF